LQVPVLKNLAQNVKDQKDGPGTGDAAARFTIGDGKIQLSDAAVNASVLGFQGGGTVGMDGALALDVVAAPLADWRDKLKQTRVPIVSDVASELAGAVQKLLNTATGTLLYQFRVEGTVQDVKVTTVPAPVLTDTAAFVFGRMLAPPKKDQRPLDWLRRSGETQSERERQAATR
jgi:hypothetical protein